MAYIEKNPLHYQTSYRNVRNALVDKFSYQVHYQIEETHCRKLSRKGDGRPERGIQEISSTLKNQIMRINRYFVKKR